MVIFAASLLAYPSALPAQRGAGGGHTGGGTAGGGGLSSTGKASGVDVKDDLKDFHATLAVQATSQQMAEYAAMVKGTEAASAELKAFQERLGKADGVLEITTRDATLQSAIDTARTENKKFLEGFSEPQKSGLKEITKRLTKADADLAQQAKALDLEVRSAKAIGQAIAASAQSLEHAVTNFQSQQIGLGEEMSIGVADNASAFNLPAVRNSVTFGNQGIAITTSGTISKGAAVSGQNIFNLELTADLSDLQQNITQVLGAQLNKAERCGERIEVQRATLTPVAPASLVVVQLHFERWACRGREANEMVEGNGMIEVKLTPSVGEGGALRLAAETGRVDAPGLVGELLRSGSLGDTLRDKITESLLSIIRQGGDFDATLPSAARGGAALHRAQFQGTGSGRLLVLLEGETRMSPEQVTSLTSELKAGESKGSSVPVAVQATVPR
jgi:hypothetical protein